MNDDEARIENEQFLNSLKALEEEHLQELEKENPEHGRQTRES